MASTTMKVNFILLLLTCLLLPATAIAQFREFTRKDGKTVVAMIADKSDQSVTIQTKDGNQFTVPIDSLSDADAQFLSTWLAPKSSFRINQFEIPKESKRKPDLTKDYYLVLITKSTPKISSTIEFSPFQKNEIIDALKEFMRLTVDLSGKQNPEFLRSDLTKINGLYERSETVWKIIIRGNRINLFPDGPGRFPDGMHGVKGNEIPLELAPYLLNYMKNFDAEGEIKKYMQLQEKLKRS